MHLYFEDTLAQIKKGLDEPLFENLIEKYLLNNSHSSILIARPKVGLAEEREREIQAELQSYKDQLSDEELEEIIKNTKELKLKQAMPDSPEDKAKIPMVALSDIDKRLKYCPLRKLWQVASRFLITQ